MNDQIKTTRIGTAYGLSLYAVKRQTPPPTFDRRDGYDGGRNLLGALLIGPSWPTIGYVLGRRGAWYAYSEAEWRAAGYGTRKGSAPLSQWSAQATVASAAQAVATIADQAAADYRAKVAS